MNVHQAATGRPVASDYPDGRSALVALTRETVLDLIPEPHKAWLTTAKPGSRVVVAVGSDEFGHVYPDVQRTPPGWTVVATKDAPTHSAPEEMM